MKRAKTIEQRGKEAVGTGQKREHEVTRIATWLRFKGDYKAKAKKKKEEEEKGRAKRWGVGKSGDLSTSSSGFS